MTDHDGGARAAMTPTEARIFAGMKPGRWMTAGRIKHEFGITGMCARENAAKHANALTRKGWLEKRHEGEPQWSRPATTPSPHPQQQGTEHE